ncbi:MAG: phosphodiester glycosidase family protein, partial [bacterium]|nr:phosphodiester glycosidase family protein [bacterium]
YERPDTWNKDAAKKPGTKKSRPPMNVDRVDMVLNRADRQKAEDIRLVVEDNQARKMAVDSALRQNRENEDMQQRQVREQQQKSRSPFKAFVAVIFAFITMFSFGWIAKNIHPDSGSAEAATVESRLELPHNLDVYINNAYADALDGVAYIKKIYTIPESATVAPKPNPAAFGETTDPAVIQAVIADAAELLDGQETLWNPNINFYPGTTMHYYRDSSILVLCWKEIYEERCCTMAEVKVAHGSQFRRRIADDSYSSSVQLYASEMAKASNAVVASNADFYAFRTYGVTAYQRQLFRAEPGKLDTCFINSSGDMLFARAGQLGDAAQIQQYMLDNDVVFSLSFGPVLVDNGELQYCESYPIGEIDTMYSRAGLGMLGDLHYLLMTVNHTDGRPRANVNEFGRYMYEKGCIKAYNMDGGQTSEIVFNGTPVNYIDFGAERTVSDIIYFASALPENEWAHSVQTEVLQ